MKDLSGQKFGKLTAIKDVGRKHGGVVWLCVCECGETREMRSSRLIHEKNPSCEKCVAAAFHGNDLAGKRYGRLTVLKRVGVDKHRHALWSCLCDCGTYVRVDACSLSTGNTKSCGCLQRECTSKRLSTHRETAGCFGETRLYIIWKKMRQRCLNKNLLDYKNYGLRGVSICREWGRYENFRDWSRENGYRDPLPSEPTNQHLTIDRIDNDGDYCPENCQWVTKGFNSTKANLLRYGRADEVEEMQAAMVAY